MIADLLLGLRMDECLSSTTTSAARAARLHHDERAAPLDSLDALGIVNPIVCANINKIGFRMCGGIPAYEDAIAKRRSRPIAMSVLASGTMLAARGNCRYAVPAARRSSRSCSASGRASVRLRMRSSAS